MSRSEKDEYIGKNSITVSQLIEKIKHFPPDAPIIVCIATEDVASDIQAVQYNEENGVVYFSDWKHHFEVNDSHE